MPFLARGHIPVFVLSNSMGGIPEGHKDHAEVISGSPSEVVQQLNARGYQNLYIDGGKTVQGFLAANLIDEMIISRLPVILGGGVPLFADLEQAQWFEHSKTEILLGELVKPHYKKKG
ncbi:dihydrofolate reductase family protein [Microbulbifer sp. 2205BS26-8]|uniref:dihydrofolate reductase family protein n=1 Tax=Microbulbifer sp. 2205BS26-8 TaxID=3064386 RepID=UPI00273DC15D|nr:dihydrofolate reductase family protein [Microbulbifer sp. 2205BS26-8]MDP5210407.1 dihydrofolate reductase family protein [Microbulbifer sp. 2205BS26-8]